MNARLRKLIFIIYETGFIWTIFLILGLQTVVNIRGLKSFPLENAGYLLVGVCCIIPILLANKKYGIQIELIMKKRSGIILCVAIVVLLVIQLYLCFGGYFSCDWDVGVIREVVLNEFRQTYDQIWSDYFSMYPNNLVLTWLFTQLWRFADSVGFPYLEFAPVAFQCLIDALTLWLVYVITFDFTNNHRLTWFVFVVSFVFLGVSPWFIVPYSDATGIIFPVLI